MAKAMKTLFLLLVLMVGMLGCNQAHTHALNSLPKHQFIFIGESGIFEQFEFRCDRCGYAYRTSMRMSNP